MIKITSILSILIVFQILFLGGSTVVRAASTVYACGSIFFESDAPVGFSCAFGSPQFSQTMSLKDSSGKVTDGAYCCGQLSSDGTTCTDPSVKKTTTGDTSITPASDPVNRDLAPLFTTLNKTIFGISGAE